MMLLRKVYAVLALPAALGVYLLCFSGKSPLFLLLLLPFYAGCFLALNAFHFVWAYVWSLFLKKSPVPERPKKFYNYLVLSTIDIIDFFAGVRTKGFDRDALPKGPFVLVCNHLSNFDPMVTAVYLQKRRMCFLSKEGNFRVPIAGPFINKAGYLCIDRDDPRKAIETVEAAVRRIRQDGMIVGFYPEGTRSKTGELGPFKDGVFLIAKKAAVPVVVLTVSGTQNVHKNFFRRFTRVRLQLAGVIDSDTVRESRTAVISKIAREMVEKTV